MNDNGNLENILKNREQRFEIKSEFAQNGFASISLNLNIPGYPKSNDDMRKAINYAITDLEDFLCATRIKIFTKKKRIIYSNSGDFCIIPTTLEDCNNKSVKEQLETFESNHPLGRLLDIDLFDNQMNPISSGKQKKCFICNQPAKVCSVNQAHQPTELQDYVTSTIQRFNKQKSDELKINEISTLALRAILFETALLNKPGLVCPDSQGAHSDMDYFTFLSSSAAISPYFKEMVRMGFSHNDIEDIQKIRVDLRIKGLQAERAMCFATNNINTQKGIIFLIGLACFAAGFTFNKYKSFNDDEFRRIIKIISQDLIENDLQKNIIATTHGEKCFKKYGKSLAGGARLEAELGFPTVFDIAIPYLNKNIKDYKELTQSDWQEILEPLLYQIIAVNNDINVLHRKNNEILKAYQQMSKDIVEDHLDNSDKKEKMIKFSLMENISPGGSADLLALSLFVHFCKQTNQ